MGPLGTEELVAIFIVALLLFGPKELPKLGKTIGKAMTEFRRAQSELKSTFNREMQNLERETGIRELANTTLGSAYNYENSTYDSAFHNEDSSHSTVTTTSVNGASATQGAEYSEQLRLTAAAGSIPSGHMDGGQNAWDPYTPVPAAPSEHSHSAPSSWEPMDHAEKNG
jgi:sec-independent protein translocase protein TatA